MSLSSSAPPYLVVEARSRQMLGLYRWVYGCPRSHVHRPVSGTRAARGTGSSI